jgi:hypothetical protein
MLIEVLADQIQIIRNNLPSGGGLVITSAVRLQSDIDRLLDLGYNPSVTSDHFFGKSILSKKNTRKIEFFGGEYYFSVGAVDLVGTKASPDEIFETCRKLARKGEISVGQVINERGSGSGWVHVSNSRKNIYDKLSQMGYFREEEPQFLTSTDNGRTYSKLNIAHDIY